MRIAIVGSREYHNLQEVRDFVHLLPKHTIVVSGGARGVDKVAADEARKRGLEVIEILAEWDKYGKSAGYLRNIEVVNLSDKVVAFWDGKSKGTKNTIDLAESKGKLLRIYKRTFHRVELPHYVCGFFAKDDIIVEAPPIMKWAIGKPISEYISWVKTKRGTVSDM